MRLVDRFVMDLTSVRLLIVLGLVVAAQAQSCTKPVPGANMGLKTSDILLETFPNGAVASFICNVGYTSAGGSPSVTCVDGSWTPVKLKCEKKSCGSAGEVPHGNVDYPEGNEFGAEARVTCDLGYNLVGNPVLRCRDQGWDGRLPTCEALTCDQPPLISNGDYDPKKEDYGYSEVIQYSCQKTYSLRGAKSLTCSENGAFKPDPPECIIVNCDDPVVEFGKFLSGSRPPHTLSASVTFECITGYHMVGERTQICDINGKWSPGLPTCKLSPTTKATTTTTTTTKATTTTTSGKQTVTTQPTDAPGSGSGDFMKYGLPILLIILVIIIAAITYSFIKKKRGSQRSKPDSEAPKQGEDIPLSK
ncbi:membrane cofactor protein-like isoform X3 [Platichthys flesus]|uniref:membrane cofactor protein-like isoform X3 n=1 Tax=Platichthys flesus TaxID=8260 RepID=UPI002DBD6C4B|nr:membrane cofactor protein-like isoform X3 [Platichthys flesus]